MKKIIYYLFILPFLTFGQSNSLCDSISVDFNSFYPVSFDSWIMAIDLNVEYTSSEGFSYAGFILTNNEGDTIGSENLSTAGNVYWIGSGISEQRTIEGSGELIFPLTIHLVSFLFAGSNQEIECSWFFLDTGCTDEKACNYNTEAIEDDGSCMYEEDELQNPIEIIYSEDSVSGEVGEDIIAPIYIRNSSCDSMSNLTVSKIESPDTEDVLTYFCFNEICFTSLTMTAPNPLNLSPFEVNDYFKGYLVSNTIGTFEVTYRFYLENEPNTFFNKTITYCVEDNCNESTIEEIKLKKHLLKTINYMGQNTTKHGVNIEIYNDGSVEKKYVIQ